MLPLEPNAAGEAPEQAEEDGAGEAEPEAPGAAVAPAHQGGVLLERRAHVLRFFGEALRQRRLGVIHLLLELPLQCARGALLRTALARVSAHRFDQGRDGGPQRLERLGRGGGGLGKLEQVGQRVADRLDVGFQVGDLGGEAALGLGERGGGRGFVGRLPFGGGLVGGPVEARTHGGQLVCDSRDVGARGALGLEHGVHGAEHALGRRVGARAVRGLALAPGELGLHGVGVGPVLGHGAGALKRGERSRARGRRPAGPEGHRDLERSATPRRGGG